MKTPRTAWMIFLIFIFNPFSFSSGATEIELQAVRWFPLQLTAVDSVAGDFNHDRRQDCAVVFEGLSGVQLLAGDGEGHFTPGPLVGGTSDPQEMGAGDLNQDSHLDLVVVDGASNSVVVFLGDGLGSFQLLNSFPVGGVLPVSLVLEDFDEDGVLDASVACRDSFDVIVLRGDGSGALSVSNVIDAVGSGLVDMASGDFDQDGHIDLAATNDINDKVATLRGDGKGGFSPFGFFPAGNNPGKIAVGDLNGDGFEDIAVAMEDYRNERVMLFFGDGAGSFPLSDSVDSFNDPDKLAVVDLNADGCSEIIAADRLDQVFVFRRSTSGGFEFVQFFQGRSGGRNLSVADFDRDGKLDVLSGGNRLSLALGDSSGGFRAATRTFNSYGSFLSAGDVNEDGNVDLASGGFVDSVKILFGDGDGGFSDGSGSYNVADCYLVDLDGDGHLDLVGTDRLSQRYDTRTAMYLGDGKGGFELSFELDFFGAGPSGVDFGDLNEDGFLDTVVTNADGMAIFLGDGTGGVLEMSLLPMSSGAFSGAVVDLNLDGHLDLITGGGEIVARLGSGEGFGPRFVAASGSAYKIHVDDLDRDDIPDLVGAEGPYGCSLTIYTGLGDGQFAFSQEYLSFQCPSKITVADLNEDGFLDIIAAGGASLPVDDPVIVLPGTESGGFGDPIRFVGGAARDVIATDSDNDGHVDLIWQDTSVLEVIRNRSFDHVDSRGGNVNGAQGPVTDVLFVNDSPGAGNERLLTLGASDPLRVSIIQPPSREMASGTNYAIYAFAGHPRPATAEEVPFSVGRTCFSTPLTGGQPAATWSTFAMTGIFGVPTFPSGLAPATLVDRPQGAGRRVKFTVQGFVIDPGSPQGILAVTNAVVATVD